MKAKTPIKNATILIVTKNRAALLHACLTSFLQQELKPKEICVIDNNSIDNTALVVREFSDSLPIMYARTQASGYPAIYNFGLSQITSRWVVFFDDDCIATEDWSTQLNAMLKKHPHMMLQGKTLSIPKQNIYAAVMGMHYDNWIIANTIGINELRTVDNKNLCVPTEIFKKYGNFDTDLIQGSEDIELGARMRRNGVKILYCPTIRAYHKERTTFSSFLAQHNRIAKSEAIADQKLSLHEKTTFVFAQKTLLHIRGAKKLALDYIRNGNVIAVFKLGLIYVLLAMIRLWSYHMTVWQTKK